MFLKKFDKSKVKKILVVSLTNIGDVILTFPVIDILREDFPSAKLDVVSGPKAVELLEHNPHFNQVQVFDKRQPVAQTLAWLGKLLKEKYDLVVDLRNSAIPFFIWPRFRTSYRIRRNNDRHMTVKHLDHLRSVYPFEAKSRKRCSIYISDKHRREEVDRLTASCREKGFVVVGAGAADRRKRWAEENFTTLCDGLGQKFSLVSVFVGDHTDAKAAGRILAKMSVEGINLCGQTDLLSLAEVIGRARLAVMNDSAPMHLASYLDKPVIALFGPTDPRLYGPWSPHCRYFSAMESVSPQEVLKCIKVENGEVTVSL